MRQRQGPRSRTIQNLRDTTYLNKESRTFRFQVRQSSLWSFPKGEMIESNLPLALQKLEVHAYSDTVDITHISK